MGDSKAAVLLDLASLCGLSLHRKWVYPLPQSGHDPGKLQMRSHIIIDVPPNVGCLCNRSGGLFLRNVEARSRHQDSREDHHDDQVQHPQGTDIFELADLNGRMDTRKCPSLPHRPNHASLLWQLQLSNDRPSDSWVQRTEPASDSSQTQWIPRPPAKRTAELAAPPTTQTCFRGPNQ